MGSELRLILFISTLSAQLLSVWAQCPAPFNLEAGKCVFVNTAQSFSWCEANRQCAMIGGELRNSYSSLHLLGSMPSMNCDCRLWLGVTDLADERGSSRSGWQRINSNDIVPLNDSIWEALTEPNMGVFENCMLQTAGSGAGKLGNNPCSIPRGFVCEFSSSAVSSPIKWKQIPFKRTSYHASTEYCYSDLTNVHSELACVMSAFNSGNCRHVLYNSKLRACRLLLFTDAQVEAEIETSADWVKFSVF